MVSVLRPGQRILNIPGIGVTTSRRAAASAAASWWAVAGKTSVGAYAAKDAASYAASKVNLANPGTYDLTNGTAYPTWGASGWAYNGTQWLVTGITPARSQTWSMLVRVTGVTWSMADYNTVIGSFSTTGGNRGFLFQASGGVVLGGRRGIWTGTTFGTHDGVPATSAVFGIAGTSWFIDGASDGTVSAGTTTGNHLALWLGGLNFNGALLQGFVGTITHLAIYSDTLTAGEVATVSAAMAAL